MKIPAELHNFNHLILLSAAGKFAIPARDVGFDELFRKRSNEGEPNEDSGLRARPWR